MFTFGAHNVSPLYISRSSCRIEALYFALASSAMTSPISFIISTSHAAAIPIACGNTVAVPALATPCTPSFHQLYAGIPNRSMAGASNLSCPIISAIVICSTNASARFFASFLFLISYLLLRRISIRPCHDINSYHYKVFSTFIRRLFPSFRKEIQRCCNHIIYKHSDIFFFTLFPFYDRIIQKCFDNQFFIACKSCL